MQFLKINLYKERDFGDLINITFAFIRENFKPLFRAHLKINLPIMLVLILLTLVMQYLVGVDFKQQFTASSEDNLFDFIDLSTSTAVLVSGITTLIFYVTLSLVNTVYMKHYFESGSDQPFDIDLTTIWEGVKRDFVPSIGGLWLYSLAIGFGFVLCLLPGFFVLAAFWLYQSAIVFEKRGGVSSLKRSYHLVKDNWWFTFGLLIVMGILSGILAAIINTPTYIFSFFVAFHIAENGNLDVLEMAPYMWVLFTVISTVLSFIGSFVNYTITQIAANFHFGNLVEQKEARGLTQTISETMDDSQNDTY